MRIVIVTFSLLLITFNLLNGSVATFDHLISDCRQTDDTIPVPGVLTVAGVGDIMMGTSFPSKKYLPPGNNPLRLIEELLDSLSKPDITFGNLEGSFLDYGEAFKLCRDTNICYLFRMPESYASVLDTAGFDFISLANNHFGDFGPPGADRTRKLLDSLGIGYAGPVENPYSIIEKDSVTYGFCAFSNTLGSNSMGESDKAAAIVRYLKDTCDIVIVSFHGGAEGSDYQRVVREDEIFYGENRGNVYDFSHKMIDSGADIIFGHGPHVSRAVELYNDRLICYSLGNFCTYGRFNITGPNGIAPLMKVNIDITGRFISGRIIPVYQGSDGIVRLDTQLRVIKKIRELTALDFPETALEITDEGEIIHKQ